MLLLLLHRRDLLSRVNRLMSGAWLALTIDRGVVYWVLSLLRNGGHALTSQSIETFAKLNRASSWQIWRVVIAWSELVWLSRVGVLLQKIVVLGLVVLGLVLLGLFLSILRDQRRTDSRNPALS